jgi:threonine/homoserine/homoserine lactone efflux protein
MAGSPTTLTPRQQALQDLAKARASLRPQWHEAAAQLSPAALIQKSVTQHRAAWAVGALVTGFLAVRMLLPSSRRKNERDSPANSAKKSGLIALIATPFFGLARKAVLSFITTQVQHFVQKSVKDQRPS